MPDFDPERFHKDLHESIHEEVHQSLRDSMRLPGKYDRMRYRHGRWQNRSGPGGALMGVLILSAGVLFLLQNLGILDIHQIWNYWPLILVALGLSRMMMAPGWAGRILGGSVALIAGLWVLHNIGVIPGNIGRILWPVWVIAFGLSMLLRNRGDGHRFMGQSRGTMPGNPGGTMPPPSSAFSGPATPHRINEYAIFGGSRRRIDSKEFLGGEAIAIFGGVEVDLRSAGITGDEVTIDANAIFGGVEIWVPQNWTITMRGMGIFGGFEDKTLDPVNTAPDAKRPNLVVTGAAVFGGVSVRN